ncbi:MAG: hypothetical protein J6E40_14295 [Lachnospiraceae bacterium]|nr:hypothetical protein [Lachnospiraceae bacterium]
MKKIIEIIMIGIVLALNCAACGSAPAETETIANTAELSATAARLIGCSEETARNLLEEINTDLGEITELDSAPQEMLPPEFKRIIKVTAEGNLYYVGIGKGDGADEYYVGNIVSSDGVLIKSLIK